MRRGLDFAWSRPGIDAIRAGGYTFVLRYLSYDLTGKNLTRKEADTYRAHGIDVVSNWEYATDAALNGYGQGVRDATEGQRQHLACGGDPAAPIYFSVDFDATEGQQAAIDAYLNGCASVIGVGRVGVYGGYWVVKRCLDNGSARWGWQTYAWSYFADYQGGPKYTHWDPRAAIWQVQNGVTVGGADCDIDEAHADNFGQWGAGGSPSEIFPYPSDQRGYDDMTPEEHNTLAATDNRIRVALLEGKETIDDTPGYGPGTPVWIVQAVKDIQAKLESPVPVAVDAAAVAAALAKDPTFLAAIATAVVDEEHARLAE